MLVVPYSSKYDADLLRLHATICTRMSSASITKHAELALPHVTAPTLGKRMQLHSTHI